MISLSEARKVLKKNQLSDDEVIKIRIELYKFAELLYQFVISEKN